MRIIFFGSSFFSIPILAALLDSKHTVVHVVTTPDQKKGRGQKISPSVVKTLAEQHNLTVTNPEKLSLPIVVDGLKKCAPDIIVIASYGKIVPSTIFTLPKIMPLNVHPSLLPRHRGASPIQQAILEGDHITGVTIGEVTKDLDAGDLLGQIEIKIGEHENALELSERLAQAGAKLLLDVINQLAAGKSSKRKQDESNATYAKKLERNCGQIDWAKPAFFLHNQVRAYYPWPSAFTYFREKRVKILETRPVTEKLENYEPGIVTRVNPKEWIYVQTKSGLLALVRVQQEGGREMSAFEFAIGQRIQVGDRLGPQ